jgi:hypothetical protein
MRACIASLVHEMQMQTCTIKLHSDGYNFLMWYESCTKSRQSHAPPMHLPYCSYTACGMAHLMLLQSTDPLELDAPSLAS